VGKTHSFVPVSVEKDVLFKVGVYRLDLGKATHYWACAVGREVQRSLAQPLILQYFVSSVRYADL
jgi:hypothetical protein